MKNNFNRTKHAKWDGGVIILDTAHVFAYLQQEQP